MLAEWYHKGLNAFEETCPMGTAIFRELGEELQQFLQKPELSAQFDDFVAKTYKRQQYLKAELEKGQDRLLELNSN